MSETPLNRPVLVLASAGTGLTGWAFAGGERRRSTVIALTLVVQACLHMAFTLAQASPASGSPTPSPQEWGRLLLCGNPSPQAAARAYDLAVETGLIHAMTMSAARGGAAMPHGMDATTGVAGTPHMGGASGSPSWSMLAAHLLAALLCGVWLAQGERAAFRVLRAVADRAFVPLRLIPAVLPVTGDPSPIRHAAPSVRRLRSRLLIHALTTRGPPGALAVA
ncbi:hypothetical protein AB0N93_31480 [Streptomyces sp. NPDC091267]|uniref:hypothetical protein n=1 Tax=Streptomyces sp. NPDC091267 TaxID=3155195 RepID=UPI0034134401